MDIQNSIVCSNICKNGTALLTYFWTHLPLLWQRQAQKWLLITIGGNHEYRGTGRKIALHSAIHPGKQKGDDAVPACPLYMLSKGKRGAGLSQGSMPSFSTFQKSALEANEGTWWRQHWLPSRAQGSRIPSPGSGQVEAALERATWHWTGGPDSGSAAPCAPRLGINETPIGILHTL